MIEVPVLAVSAGESAGSRTTALVMAGLAHAGGIEAGHRLVELSKLDAAGLLGRTEDPDVTEVRTAVCEARVLVLASPVYRATYAASLKALMDWLPQSALAGCGVVLVATAGSRDHFLSIDTGFRSLVASLDGWSVPTSVYATPADFDEDRQPLPDIVDRLCAAMAEAAAVASVR